MLKMRWELSVARASPLFKDYPRTMQIGILTNKGEICDTSFCR